METKVLLRLIRDDIKLLDEINSSFIGDTDFNSEEVDMALVRARAIVTELEMLAKNLATKPKAPFKPNTQITEKRVVNVAPVPLSTPKLPDLIVLDEELEEVAAQNEPQEHVIEPIIIAQKPEPKAEIVVEKPAETVVEEKPSVKEPQQTEATKEPENEKEQTKRTLGESIVEAHRLINDLLSNDKGDQFFEGNPLKSIREGIGLNDRFLFVRELFASDSTHYNETLDKLDSFSSINEAVEFLKLNYKWSKSEASEKFLQLVKRRYTL